MKINMISIVLLGVLAFALALAPVEAAVPERSGVVESGEPIITGASPEIAGGIYGPNIPVFLNGNAQNEPEVAINPADSTKLAAGANDYSFRSGWAGYYFSTDEGRIWRNGLIPWGGSLSTYAATGDPVLVFDGRTRPNTAYYAGIAFNRFDPRNAVWVAKSTDNGATYADPVILENTLVSSTFHDKPWIAADKGNGNVYVTWTKFIIGASPIVFKSSTDGGLTYSSEVAVSDPVNNQDQGSQVAVGPGGEVYVAWEDFNVNRILFDKSTNGGVSFGTDMPVRNIFPIPNPLPGFRFRDNSFPVMAVDTSSGPNRGNIYIAWADYGNGDADVLFTRSVDRGISWSPPMRVNDDSLKNGRHQFFPAMDVDEKGRINIVFYDNRDDPAKLNVYYTESLDGGLSFSPNAKITDAPFNPAVGDVFVSPFIGDYIGIASGNDIAHPVWMDTRTGNQDIFTDLHQKGAIGGGAIPEFPTVALPVVGVIGIMFLFLRRKPTN